jgi:hypothetical protein
VRRRSTVHSTTENTQRREEKLVRTLNSNSIWNARGLCQMVTQCKASMGRMGSVRIGYGMCEASFKMHGFWMLLNGAWMPAKKVGV